MEMRRNDGSSAWIQLTVRPVKDEEGKVVQSHSIAVDATDLKRTEREMRQSEEKFRTLFESANDAIFLMKGDLFVDCNPPTEKLFGCTRNQIIGQAPHCFSPEIQPDGRNSREAALEKITAVLEGTSQVFEWQHCRLDRSLVDTEVSLNRLKLPGETLLMAIVRDITEHRRSKKEIQNQLAEISSYYDNAPIGLAVLDLDLRFVRINSMLADINGFPAADHVGKSVKEIVPGLEDTVQKITAEILKTGKPVTDMELVGKTASQPGINRFWLESWYPIVDDAHKITGFSVIIKEITERKRAREEIEKVNQQLRSLSSHLLDTLEKERLSIAREIHDDFGQTLSALKMDINWVRKRLSPDQRPVMDKLGTMTSIINQSVQSVKRICTKLRPAVLDDLGLSDALEWYTAQFQEQTGIRCSLDTETAAMKVNSHIKTAVFRICQEALTNVRRHSKATSVDISLKFTGNWITLEIKDNGKGISNFALIRSKAFGVVGMRERVHAFGGDFDISGQPGVGTCIRVVIPLPN
ncbi:MAG: PAS domain S-box protein [Desulfotignum sp.]|nr:PAS domain S-box protein [Desulfotignum sp.]MCF8088903.1 PAS domain S-box protein [Desulfotignum sp.]MCF8138503.1 PAS domain S-box protein [Desulfotignum sp.]